MVKNTGKTPGPGAIQPLNSPKPVVVEEKEGLPWGIMLTGENAGNSKSLKPNSRQSSIPTCRDHEQRKERCHCKESPTCRGDEAISRITTGPLTDSAKRRGWLRYARNDGQHAFSEQYRNPKFLKVASVEDSWRVDEEWWREKPVSRLYFDVLLADGRRITIFKELVQGKWYKQKC